MDYYCIPGETQPILCKEKHAPSGTVLMNEQRPTPDHIATADGTWVIDELKVWEAEIALTDKVLPRYIEDLYDANPTLIKGAWIAEVYQNKKDIRAKKPEKA